MSKNFFINNLDSYIGSELKNQLLGDPNDEENESENTVIGTKIDPKDHAKPPGVRKILWRHKKLLYRKYVSEQDVAVYDTFYGDITEVERGIESFVKAKDLEGEKVLILISHLLGWSGNEKKEKEIEEVVEPEPEEDPEGNGEEEEGEGEQEDGGENGEQEGEAKDASGDGEGEGEQEDGEGEGEGEGEEEGEKPESEVEEEQEPPEPVYIPWSDDDYRERIPLEKYQKIKEIEDMVLGLEMEGVKTYVICAGLVYGNGEDFLRNYLETAWKQNPKELEFENEGDNFVPSIHVKDLCQFVIKITELQPEKKYHFAFDNNKDKTLKNLISGISRTVGSGFIKSVERTSLIRDTGFDRDMFSLNLWCYPSALLVDHSTLYLDMLESSEVEKKEGEEEQDGEAENELMEFQWHCETGFEDNGAKILQEFNAAYQHRPLMIYITGAQKARKSEFSQLIADEYRIPRLTLKEVFEDVENRCKDILYNDFVEEKEKIEEILANEGMNFEITETTKVIYRCIKWRLNQNDCRNRGFVLDDPKLGVKDLQVIFHDQKKKLKRVRPKPIKKKKRRRKKKKVEEEEEQENNNEENEEGNEEAEAKEEQEPAEEEENEEGGEENGQEENQAQEEEEEWEEEEEEEEQEEQEEGNDGEGEEEEEDEEGAGPPKEKFFPESFIFFEVSTEDGASYEGEKQDLRVTEIQDWCENTGLDTFSVNVLSDSKFEGLETLRLFIERNGRPNNYLTEVNVLKDKHLDFYHQEDETRKREEEMKQSMVMDSLKNAKDQRLNNAIGVVTHLKENETMKKDLESIPVRKYLTTYLEPVLTEGLEKIIEIKPNDVVDFLAEYMYRRSYEF